MLCSQEHSKHIFKELGKSEYMFSLSLLCFIFQIVRSNGLSSAYKLSYVLFIKIPYASVKITGPRRNNENSKHCQDKRHTLRLQMMKPIDQLPYIMS